MFDIQEIRASYVEEKPRVEQGFNVASELRWSVGSSLSFPFNHQGHWATRIYSDKVPTTLESDGKGHFTFSSTGQRFQGTTTNDGATTVFRPKTRVVPDFEARCDEQKLDLYGTYRPHCKFTNVQGVLECVRATMRP